MPTRNKDGQTQSTVEGARVLLSSDSPVVVFRWRGGRQLRIAMLAKQGFRNWRRANGLSASQIQAAQEAVREYARGTDGDYPPARLYESDLLRRAALVFNREHGLPPGSLDIQPPDDEEEARLNWGGSHTTQ